MAKSVDGATPAMSQWFAMKADHPDALLFFRMGDFYELFFEDAEAAVAALDIQLTHRGEHAGKPIAMCGVPCHAAENYLARLIRRGFRVAVAEQMEAASKGKTPIRRQVVRVVTPGTVVEDALLDQSRPNLLMALVAVDQGYGAAWMDISTGAFETAFAAPADLAALLGRLDPAEILAAETIDLGEWTARRAPEQPAPLMATARARLAEAFGVADLDAFGHFSDAETIAAIAALDYARMTQAGQLPRLSHPVPIGEAGLMQMDAATRASLELTRARDGSTEHTLAAAVGRTVSAAGGRLLAARLHAPLTDPVAIQARQAEWGWLLEHTGVWLNLRMVLKATPDMARALGRLGLGRVVARDLGVIRDGLTAGHEAAALLEGAAPFLSLSPVLQAGGELRETLLCALNDVLPLKPGEGGAIAPGYDDQLDAHRALRDESRHVIAGLQAEYAQRFGVASLKIRHHQQLGYIIEVPTAAVEKLRDNPELHLRQGMANGARFTYPPLSELDRKISEAAEQASAREQEIIGHLVRAILAQAGEIASCAQALAQLDVAGGAASLAQSGRWVCPEIRDDTAFQITAGRHPVVEAAIGGTAPFVPNDCDLSPDRRVLLLTGPNMAGKSTFLRQNALMVILAQAGFPVPAERAVIGVVDRLFSRVGASDDLARGRSTFMVEMTETAAILHGAGPRSLVVVDEIGRGTATLDGLAIAWAVLEALHFGNRCRTIFATHFHELAQQGGELSRLRPHTMRVREWRGDVVFLHEVAEGAAGRSWGVHVAKLAGVPAPTVRRAGQLLSALERNGPLTVSAALPLFAASASSHPDPEGEQAAGQSNDTPGVDTQMRPDPLRNFLQEIDPDSCSPREALEALYRLKKLQAEELSSSR